MPLSPANFGTYAGLLFAGATLLPPRFRPAGAALALATAYPLAWVLTGLLGALSYTTGALAWLFALHRLAPARFPLRPGMSAASAALLLAVGLSVQLSAVGPLKVELYHGFGTDHPGLVAAVMWLTALPSAFPLRGYAVALPLVALLSPWRGHDSPNAWDLFLDPLLLAGAAAGLIASGSCRFRRRTAPAA